MSKPRPGSSETREKPSVTGEPLAGDVVLGVELVVEVDGVARCRRHGAGDVHCHGLGQSPTAHLEDGLEVELAHRGRSSYQVADGRVDHVGVGHAQAAPHGPPPSFHDPPCTTVSCVRRRSSRQLSMSAVSKGSSIQWTMG